MFSTALQSSPAPPAPRQPQTRFLPLQLCLSRNFSQKGNVQAVTLYLAALSTELLKFIDVTAIGHRSPSAARGPLRGLPSARGDLRVTPFPTALNKAAGTSGDSLCAHEHFILWTCLGTGLLGRKGNAFKFRRPFSKVAEPFGIPVLFAGSTSSPALGTVGLSLCAPPRGTERGLAVVSMTGEVGRLLARSPPSRHLRGVWISRTLSTVLPLSRLPSSYILVTSPWADT